MAPVALGIEVAEEELALQAMGDRGDASRDLAGDEVSPRNGLSWLNRILFEAWMP
jgi:hypothetical protein